MSLFRFRGPGLDVEFVTRGSEVRSGLYGGTGPPEKNLRAGRLFLELSLIRFRGPGLDGEFVTRGSEIRSGLYGGT